VGVGDLVEALVTGLKAGAFEVRGAGVFEKVKALCLDPLVAVAVVAVGHVELRNTGVGADDASARSGAESSAQRAGTMV